MKTNITAFVILAGIASGNAALTLTNGSFENVGGPVGPVTTQASGDWVQESSFIASSVLIQDASVESGTEGMTATDGNRFLRLADDANFNAAAGPGAVHQDLGTITVGETYTFTGDYFQDITTAESPDIGDFLFTVELRRDSATGPVLASYSDTISKLTGGSLSFSGSDLQYTALAADDGAAAFLRVSTSTPAVGVVRGGADNLTLTTQPVPEPSSALLLCLGGLALSCRRRKAL